MSEKQYSKDHLGGLRRFAIAITVLNILGHTVLGFEQSYAQPLVALITAYSTQILLEIVESWSCQRPVRFLGGVGRIVDFLLSAHISGLAVAMLLYANDSLWVIAFAASVAVGSKSVFRAPVGQGTRHFFNPSNLGISVTLLLFPWVGLAQPYHFTENLSGVGDWILPGIIIATGTFLNARFTKRLPLIFAWLGGFALQAVLRSLWFQTPLVAGLAIMTGVAFILFTFYMVTDPVTTPERPMGQMVFGFSVAATYGLLMVTHVVYGLFFSLSIVCAFRGINLYLLAWEGARSRPALPPQQRYVVIRPALQEETAR